MKTERIFCKPKTRCAINHDDVFHAVVIDRFVIGTTYQ